MTAAATFLLSVVVGHWLGAAALGTFAFAVSVARIFFASTDLGLGSHLTRVVARDRTTADRIAQPLFTFRACLIPVAIVVTTVVGVAAGPGDPAVYAFIAVAMGTVTLQMLYEALLLAHDRARSVAALNIVGATCLAGGCATWIVARGGLREFAMLYAVTSTAALIVWGARVARELTILPRPRFDARAVVSELRKSWPIGFSNLLGIAALKSPVIILGVLSTADDVGTFSAVDVFVTASAILQSAVSSATFPHLAASHGTDPARFRRWFWLSNAILLAAGILVGGGLVLFGADIASLAFPGKDFARIGELMPIIGWSTPALLLVHHNILVFAAIDKERTNLLLMIAWCSVIVACQIALVPTHGVIGAVWGVLVGRLVGLAVIAVAVLRAALPRR